MTSPIDPFTLEGRVRRLEDKIAKLEEIVGLDGWLSPSETLAARVDRLEDTIRDVVSERG